MSSQLDVCLTRNFFFLIFLLVDVGWGLELLVYLLGGCNDNNNNDLFAQVGCLFTCLLEDEKILHFSW